jgi:hypothetical protein
MDGSGVLIQSSEFGFYFTTPLTQLEEKSIINVKNVSNPRIGHILILVDIDVKGCCAQLKLLS